MRFSRRVDRGRDLLQQHQHFAQRQSSSGAQQVDQRKAFEPFEYDKTNISLSFDCEELDEVRMGVDFDAIGFFIDLRENRGVSQKNLHGDPHPGHGIFRVEDVARICRINILDQAIAVLKQ